MVRREKLDFALHIKHHGMFFGSQQQSCIQIIDLDVIRLVCRVGEYKVVVFLIK